MAIGSISDGEQGSSVRTKLNLVITDVNSLDPVSAVARTDAAQIFTDAVTVQGVLTLTTDLTVSNGGTGVSSLTDGGILLGSGTGGITATAVLADGEMIVGDGSTDPAIESGATLRTSIGLGNVDDTSDANKPISTATQTALDLKAALVSPVFTGDPTGPTPAAGDNDTSLATTAYVQTELTDTIASAWVNFDGTGTVSITDQLNVSSITDNGTGDYTVNFATALANTTYVVSCTALTGTTASVLNISGPSGTGADLKSTTQLQVVARNTADTLTDQAEAHVIILGGV